MIYATFLRNESACKNGKFTNFYISKKGRLKFKVYCDNIFLPMTNF
jgi:hypothetical protein